jgi:YkoY family integral membrane protein
VGGGGAPASLSRDRIAAFEGYSAFVFLDVHITDFVTIGLLVLLEGLLSADNALVLAILVLGLPREEQQKALRYGILGAFVFRGLATVLAAYLIDVAWVKLVGAAYLLYLPYAHFTQHHEEEGGRRAHKPARPWLGLSAFWATVVKVELTDIVFAIDSILVAVAMSNKLWVIVTGGILGIIAMRMLIGQLLTVVQRYPPLVDGAFVIIAWVGLKLLLEYAHQMHWVGFAVPKWFSLGVIVVIFVASYAYARRVGAVEVSDDTPPDAAEALFKAADDPSDAKASERGQSGQGR